MTLRLGKLAPTRDARDLVFAHYRTPAPIKVPTTFGHYPLVKEWEMLGNGPDDSVQPGFQGAGDCVFAGGDHETMLWNAEAKTTVTVTGRQAIADYSAVTGYVINDDATDQGTDVRTALKYRQKTGLLDSHGNRHKIAVYVALEPGNLTELAEAAYLFGAVGIGIQFPDSAMDQFNAGKPWSVVAGSQVEGGHYVPVVGRPSGTYFDCVTWARVQKMTHGFITKYCDEAWAIISTEALAGGKSLEGFDLAQLKADLAALR
jgi:hypothetical protein